MREVKRKAYGNPPDFRRETVAPARVTVSFPYPGQKNGIRRQANHQRKKRMSNFSSATNE